MFAILFKMLSPRLWGLWGLFGVIFLAALSVGTTRAQDGIPDNCEYTNTTYYQANVFPRYEPQNQRLMLVDWTTGTDVKVVAESLPFTRVMGWSVDCRYLVGAVGADDSMDTVVWDVTNSTVIGSVADAHGQPHPITWGPNNYLVVETRNGAILWNVPANTQLTLTTSFNDFTARNFSRLRWDAANNQLIVNLAVGGRAVYDLTTGQEVPEAVNITDSALGDGVGTIVIGGKPYQCNGNYVDRVQAVYDATTRSIYLEAYDAYPKHGKPAETIAMLENDIDVSFLQSGRWSYHCRYFAASLGRLGEDVSDTYVWDIFEGGRVGVFDDAREITHPLHWVGESLVVETRNGAYFWNLANDNRILLTSEVEFPITGRSNVRNFENLVYDSSRNLFFITPLAETTTLAYDANSGQQVVAEPPVNQTYIYQRPALEQTLVAHRPIEGESGFRSQGLIRYNPATRENECNGMAIVYDSALQQTIIVNIATGTMVSVLQGDERDFDWSPNCQTLDSEYSLLERDSTVYDNAPLDDFSQDRMSDVVVFWDVATGAVLKEFPNPYRDGLYSSVRWSPSGDRAIVITTEGYFLYQPSTGQSMLLVFPNQYFAPIYWDYARGQVLVSGTDAVYAFDLQTGVQRYRFGPSSLYSVLDDNQTLLINSFERLFIWNLDTVEYIEIDIRGGTGYVNDLTALSPDKRYLVIAYNMIRVWDLQNLPEDVLDRDPIHNFNGPDARIRSVTFIDNTTIETVTSQGTQRWNIETGELISNE